LLVNTFTTEALLSEQEQFTPDPPKQGIWVLAGASVKQKVHCRITVELPFKIETAGDDKTTYDIKQTHSGYTFHRTCTHKKLPKKTPVASVRFVIITRAFGLVKNKAILATRCLAGVNRAGLLQMVLLNPKL